MATDIKYIEELANQTEVFDSPRDFLRAILTPEHPDKKGYTRFGAFLEKNARHFVWINVQAPRELTHNHTQALSMYPAAVFTRWQAAVEQLHQRLLDEELAKEDKRKWISLSDIMDRWPAVVGKDFVPRFFAVCRKDNDVMELREHHYFKQNDLVLISYLDKNTIQIHFHAIDDPLSLSDFVEVGGRRFWFDEWLEESQLNRQVDCYIGYEDRSTGRQARLWAAVAKVGEDVFRELTNVTDSLFRPDAIRDGILRCARQHDIADVSSALNFYRKPWMRRPPVPWFSADTALHNDENGAQQADMAEFLGVGREAIDINSAKTLLQWSTEGYRYRGARWHLVRKLLDKLGLAIESNLSDDDVVAIPTTPGIAFFLALRTFVHNFPGTTLHLGVFEHRTEHSVAYLVARLPMSYEEAKVAWETLQASDLSKNFYKLRAAAIHGWTNEDDRVRDDPNKTLHTTGAFAKFEVLLSREAGLRNVPELHFIWKTMRRTPILRPVLAGATVVVCDVAAYAGSTFADGIRIASEALGKNVVACDTMDQVHAFVRPRAATLVLHTGSDERALERVVDDAPPGTVVIVVSSVGFAGGERPYVTSSDVRVLHLRPPMEGISRDEWQEILAAVINFDSNREVIDRFFRDAGDEIFALSIVSQTFLMAFALSAPESLPDSVLGALAAIGLDGTERDSWRCELDQVAVNKMASPAWLWSAMGAGSDKAAGISRLKRCLQPLGALTDGLFSFLLEDPTAELPLATVANELARMVSATWSNA